jgi:outer membrane protein assembly factor BamB
MLTASVILALILQTQSGAAAQPPAAKAAAAVHAINEELWNAARDGDVARVTKALENGADVNAKTRYGATALTFAADKGRIDVVKLLIERGADVNAQDSFYQMRAVDMAMMNDHSDVALVLLARGSKGVMNVLMMGIQRKNLPVVTAAVASPELTLENVTTALTAAKRAGSPEIVAMLEKKAASMPAPEAPPAVTIDAATLQSYAGTYRDEASGTTMVVTVNGQQLNASLGGQPPVTLVATSPTSFRIAEIAGVTLGFQGRGGLTERVVATRNNATQNFERVAAPAAGSAPAAGAAAPPPTPPKADAAPVKPAARTAARPWPGFRGDNAAGNGDGQGAVAQWNIETGQNVLWKTPVPGISTSSPIVWGNRVFVVTAISGKGDKTFRTGLYGDVAPVEDVSEHAWRIYCLDRASGRILWEQDAFTGVPKVKRHPKSSQANSTPVTDGTRVVAAFGSIGIMAAWDMDGRPLWRADIGVINNGWFFDPTYQWGHSSSPIIHRDKVILQADQYSNSYIAAFDVKTGKQVWRTGRDEISSWGTPTIFRAGGREQIVTNGPKVRAYDPETGKLLWTLGPNSEVTVGTPVVGEDLVFVTGGYPPARPVYAIKPNATGDITMVKEKPATDFVAWSNGEGTYIPSPIYYDGLLYTCGNNGVLSAYDAKTGERIYRNRVGGGGSFAASPIAADGRLYFANEDGEVIVVRAGRTYEELGKNAMKEVIMGTPAISDGVIVIRTLGHVYGIGTK